MLISAFNLFSEDFPLILCRLDKETICLAKLSEPSMAQTNKSEGSKASSSFLTKFNGRLGKALINSTIKYSLASFCSKHCLINVRISKTWLESFMIVFKTWIISKCSSRASSSNIISSKSNSCFILGCIHDNSGPGV